MFKTNKAIAPTYEQLKGFISHIRSQCIRHRDQTRDIKTTVDELLPLLMEADRRLEYIPPGLLEYAKQQENDPTYDVEAKVAAIRTAIQASISWIVVNVPTDPVTGTLNERVLNPDGTITLAIVTDAKAIEAVAKIQVVIDLIE